jgi:hypothetical protein
MAVLGRRRKVRTREGPVAVTKTSRSQPLQRSSIQPWLRDHYAALRADAGPRWEHTRAVVAPVLADTSNKVRYELVPAAAHLSSRVADEAAQRSAPLRAEVSDRAAATLAAARGGVTARQIEQLQHKRSHRKLWFIASAAGIGAVVGTAAMVWQRSRYKDWVEDDAVHSALDPEDAKADRMDTADHDDPADPDGGIEANASSSGRRAKH